MTIIDTCNPCKCRGGYVDKETYRSAVIELLCKLVGEGGSGIMYDFEILCDPTSDEPKIVRYKYEAGSTDITADAYNLDGTPYTGTIDNLVQCSAKDSEIEVLYDVNNAGTSSTPFIRTYVKNPDGTVVRVVDTALDGTTAYTVQGNVVSPGQTTSCTQEMIDTTVVNGQTVKIEFLRTYYKNSVGTITGYKDSALDGTDYTVTGIVSFADRVVVASPQKEIVNTSATTVTVSVDENTRYVYTQPLTSLTIGAVEDSLLESELDFTTGSTFSFTATPLTNKWIDMAPTWLPNTHYIIVIKSGYASWGIVGY
jgi:hypothetical protein